MSEPEVEHALFKLKQIISDLGPLGIAVSGGVDSMTLAHIAHSSDTDTKIFHALSPAVPESATVRVKRYAKKYKWNLILINAKEMEDPDYVRNPVNRCFFCKSNLYNTIRKSSSGNIASGTNTDDLSDYRPGLIAASDNDISHPFVKAGIDKAMVRKLAKHYGLADLQDLPASPCLSSRVSTGLVIEPELLSLIDLVENQVRDFLDKKINFESVRCRIHKERVTIQLETDEKLDREFAYSEDLHQLVSKAFLKTKFERYSEKISLRPYEKGSAFLKDMPII